MDIQDIPSNSDRTVPHRDTPLRFAVGAIVFLFTAGFCGTSLATLRVWTNTLGGNWSLASNWQPSGVPGVSDSAYITNNGTYTVYATNTVNVSSGVVGGTSGTQTLLLDDGITFTCSLIHVQSNAVLQISNATYSGHIELHTNGQMWLDGPSTKFFANMWFLNYGGTVLWRDGTVSMTGTIAWIENDGLWQMEGDGFLSATAASVTWTNKGTLSKVSGTGETRIANFYFVNEPGGLVDAQTGLLNIQGGTTNVLGGTFNADAGATLKLSGQSYYDAAGVFTGAGLNQFAANYLYLRTNDLPGLKLMSGRVFLGTNFQESGYITNLTLDGTILDGTNHVRDGTLTVNSGGFGVALDVQPSGKLVLATSATKNIVGSILINEGTVIWSDGAVQWGSGTNLNTGVWEIQGDNQIYKASGTTPLFENGGTVIKTGSGGDMTRFDGINFLNTAQGIVEVDAGTLRMPQNYTNTDGTLRLNSGTLGGSTGGFLGLGPLYIAGGTLEGNGTVGSSLGATGGMISPGNSPGLLTFQSGFNAGAGTTLSIDGTGTTPGTGYDQLSVTGAVAISNCTLQVASLPTVPVGTVFTIINNDGSDAVQGTFAGLPENSVVSSGAGSYRIHYAGGTGNDVVLVSESGTLPVSPTLSSGGYTNGSFRVLGNGSSTLVYTIQASTNLLQWTNIGTATGDLGGALNFLDTNAAKFRYRFYRTTN